MPNIRDDYYGCWTCGQDPCVCGEEDDNYYDNLPELHHKIFEGKTAAEAKAKAEKNAPASVKSIDITRDVQEKKAVGEGKDRNTAILAAEKSVPANAFDTGAPSVLQDSRCGETVIQAMSESDVKKIWKHGAPDNAVLNECECKSLPNKGFIGFGRKHGIWKVQWQTPVKVGLTYKLPAQVTLTYEE